MNHIISPSILNADLGNLEKVVLMINGSQADWVHLDIMDGVFVPNISFGFPVIEYVKKISEKPLDVHLMIVDPDRYLSRFRDAGAKILTFHYETVENPMEVIEKIKNELGEWMESKNYKSIDEFRGKLSKNKLSNNPFIYKRAQYVDLLLNSEVIFGTTK